MNRLIPAIVIICMGLLTVTSCKKKSSGSTCVCTERGSHDQDTVVSFSTVDTPFTNLSDECTASDALLKLDSSRYGCHM